MVAAKSGTFGTTCFCCTSSSKGPADNILTLVRADSSYKIKYATSLLIRMASFALISYAEKSDDVPHFSIQDASLSLLPALTNRPLSPEMKAKEERGADGAEACKRGGRGRRTISLLCRLIWFNPCGAAIEFPSKPFP